MDKGNKCLSASENGSKLQASWWSTHRHDVIVYLMFAVVSLTIFMVPMRNGDELWNYQFAKNIAEGKLPYRDFSIVQTPLSAYLAAPFILIFGGGLFAYRIAGYILSFLIAVENYRVCKKATGGWALSFAVTSAIILLNATYIIFNYNTLTTLFLLVILDLELSRVDTKRHQILIGLIVGLLPLLKQTTGALAMAANFIVALIYVVVYKKDKTAQALCVLVSAIPLVLYAIFLLVTQTFDDFWEYAILGISTFTHKFSFWELITTYPFYLVPTALIIMEFWLAIKGMVKKTLTPPQTAAFWFSVSWFVIAYPLCDPSHYLAVFYLVIPAVVILLPNSQKIEALGKKILCIGGTILCVLALIISWPSEDNLMFSKNKNYEGIPITWGVENTVNKVTDYILEQEAKGYEVKIASTSAACYHIPLDRYEKNWSMLLVGNIGMCTVEDLLESDAPRMYLVLPDNTSLADQSHYELINYIRNNYTMVDTYGAFSVYVTDPSLF